VARRSTGSVLEPDRTPPLTLADKHADLLRFIAQKESKCMELRSQLAAHEAELLALKQKWERIVNKGFDRVISNSSAPSHTPAVSSLDGLKEGVQGVGRILAAGLSDFAAPPPATSIPPRTHATQQSTSSVTTNSSVSTRFSQSSMASSVAEDDFPLESPEEEEEHQVLIVDDNGPTPTVTSSPPIDIVVIEDKSAKTLRRRSREAPTAVVPASNRESNRTKAAKMTMAPASSIPGLGTFPAGSPSWVMGTVNKKWEELQKTETFTKNQKRASILISDVSQSLMNAWSSPLASPAPASPFIMAASPMGQRSPSGSSLLDDDVDTLKPLGAVMTPDSKGLPKRVHTPVSAADDDEEWNW